MLEIRNEQARPTAVAPGPERVELIVNGRPRPLCSTEHVLLRSNEFWSGYRLEVVRVRSAGELEHVATPCNRVVYAAAGTYDVRYRADAHEARRRLSPGTFCFIRRGYEFERVAWKARSLEAVIVDITDLGSDPSPVDAFGRTDALFDMYVGIKDARVSTLIELMRAEIEAGCPTGVVYGEVAVPRARVARRFDLHSHPGYTTPGDNALRKAVEAGDRLRRDPPCPGSHDRASRVPRKHEPVPLRPLLQGDDGPDATPVRHPRTYRARSRDAIVGAANSGRRRNGARLCQPKPFRRHLSQGHRHDAGTPADWFLTSPTLELSLHD